MKQYNLVVCVALAACLCTEALRGRERSVRQTGADSGKDVAVKKDLGEQTDSALFMSTVNATNANEATMIEKMTVANAMHIIREKAPESISELQEQLDLAEGHHRNLRSKQPDGGVAAAQAAGAYSSGAQKALDMLNKMLLEAGEKMDFEIVRCDSEERTNLAQLAEIRADINMFNGMAANAATNMNKAKGDGTRFEGLLTDTKEEFETSSSTCTVERTDLEQKIKVVSGDLKVMKKVVALTDCGDASSAASFYQCVDTRTNRTWTEMKAQPQLQEAISKLQNSKVRKILEDGNIFLENGQEPAGSGLTEPEAGQTTGAAAQTTKCSLSSSPQCPKIREKFTDLAGEVLDSFNELSLMLKNLNLHCKETNAAISAMINNYDTVISETNGKLSDSTKDWGTYGGQKGQKEGEEQDVHKEHMDTMTGCRVNIENLASEKCALKKIRGELLNMDSLPSNITDCEIGEWTEEACSVHCGGGTQKLTRAATPGWKGTTCPAAEAEQSCQEGRCPVDCVMEEWSEWGACTALCDGGIKEKSRGIKVPALTSDAVQCEATAETVPCNTHACSGNCELADWTSWATECNKPCGGGEVTRVKTLLKPAFGTGTCAAFYDEERYQTKACNTHSCPPTEKPMTCTSKTDVVILVDGSASMEREGWDEVVKGAATLSRAFNGSEVKLSTLLFSGPKNFDHVGPCIGMMTGQPSNATAINAVDDCGMQWITHFTENKTGEAMAEEIEKMEFPQATTLTSMALAQASAELAHGREDANSVVIVLTDGAPLSLLECSKQSAKLKKKARLMWVPVGDKFPDDSVFQPWASTPWKDNIVRVKDIHEVASSFTINSILTNFCPDLWFGGETIQELMTSEVSLPGQVNLS